MGLNRETECQFDSATGRWSCWPSAATDAVNGPTNGTDRDLEIFRISAEHFRHDLSALWNHSSYFLLIQGALFSVFASVLGGTVKPQEAVLVSHRHEAFLLIGVGLVFAVFWAWVAYRRVKLIEEWRKNMAHLDGCVDQHGVYLRVEPNVSAHWWYGPSAFTAKLPQLVILMWLGGLWVAVS